MRIRWQGAGLVSALKWHQACDSYDTAGVFEGLIRSQNGIDKDSDVIWGDKTPSYLVHIPFIKELYPEAKIIHIIRDVRDCCLSINHAWNKNMLRAAQRWVDYVSKARIDGKAFQTYLEIKYEDLLENPKREMKTICGFLDVDFIEDVLKLSRPSEKSGDAKGKPFILRDNIRKYKTRMKARDQRVIEEVAGELLRELGYPTTYSGPIRRIGWVRMQIYKFVDGINLIWRGKIKNLSDVKVSATRRY